MPELPEVETVRRGVRQRVIGQRIANTIINERRLRAPIDSRFCKQTRGRRINNLRRRGKYLIFDLDCGAFIVHLGMSGVLYFSSSPPNRNLHEHVGFKIGDAFLVYKDPRRFGCIVFCKSDPDSHPMLNRLGPEPLSAKFNGAMLRANLRGRATPIKSALLDGKVVAGIGNIYASESLHLAKIRPQTPAKQLSAARAEKLAAAIKTVLQNAIRAGGSTIRDFTNASGAPGYFQTQWKVYAREGEKCCCGGTIQKIVQTARATYYCPRCQR